MNSSTQNTAAFDAVTLDEFLRIADVATALRRQQKVVEVQLDQHEARKDLVRRLLGAAKETGEDITPELAGVAVDAYYGNMYSFKQPKKDWRYKLAVMYVNRDRILKRRVLPTGIILALGLIGYVSFLDIDAARIAHAEGNVEDAVLSAYTGKQSLHNQIKNISESPFLQSTDTTGFPDVDKKKIKAMMADLERRLGGSDSFFKAFCSDGTSKDDVTESNYEEAEKRLPTVLDSYEEVKLQLSDASKVLDTHQTLLSMNKSLDSLIAQVRNAKPPQVLMEKAEIYYANATAHIKNRQVSEATREQELLVALQADIGQYSNLSTRLNQLHSSINSVVKEEAARQDAESWYKQGTAYMESGDVIGLRDSVDRLQKLDGLLNQEYTIYIVGGDIRKPDENPNIRRYYVLVQAKDKSGNIVPVTIEHEEQPGKMITVNMWGERVGMGSVGSKEPPLYAKVKADKIDNQVIDDNEFGEKRRGHRSITTTMLDVNGKIFERQAQYPR